MTSKPMTNSCPQCGAELPADAPQGLCPKCLLMGVAAPTEPRLSAADRPVSPPLDAVRAAFPHLEILGLIGQGGMGAVFKARQPKLNRYVALKILPETMSTQAAFAERFAREAQMLARLHHPNIVTVHDFGQANGFFYLLMEFVDGVNLRQAAAAGRFTPEQALAIVPMICEALQYAHDEGVLHRDIKPENILLDTRGRVRLVDFGIAKLASSTSAAPQASTGLQPTDAALTQSGSALGTPSYMAPEQQISPETVDQRADIYSLGVVFYELLTGELPVGRFAPPSQKTPVDRRIDDLVLRAMAHEKEQRFPTAAAIKTTIESITGERHDPGALPAAAEGHPVFLTPALVNGLLVGMTLLIGFTAFQLLNVRLLDWLWWRTGSNPGQAVWVVAAFAACGGLVFALWRRRQWFIGPFQDCGLWAGGPDGALSRTRPSRLGLLRQACLAFIALLSVQAAFVLFHQMSLGVQALMMRRGDYGLTLLPLGATLSPTLLAMLLLVYLVRRELRREVATIPAPPAPWMGRAALLFVAFGAATCLPIPWNNGPVVILSMGGFVATGALALLIRSRIWRAIALGLLIEHLLNATSGLIILSMALSSGRLQGHWADAGLPLAGFGWILTTQILSIICYATGLAAFLLPSARAAFGIRPPAAPVLAPSASPA